MGGRKPWSQQPELQQLGPPPEKHEGIAVPQQESQQGGGQQGGGQQGWQQQSGVGMQ
jgi:hypothetical protein